MYGRRPVSDCDFAGLVHRRGALSASFAVTAGMHFLSTCLRCSRRCWFCAGAVAACRSADCAGMVSAVGNLQHALNSLWSEQHECPFDPRCGGRIDRSFRRPGARRRCRHPRQRRTHCGTRCGSGAAGRGAGPGCTRMRGLPGLGQHPSPPVPESAEGRAGRHRPAAVRLAGHGALSAPEALFARVAGTGRHRGTGRAAAVGHHHLCGPSLSVLRRRRRRAGRRAVLGGRTAGHPLRAVPRRRHRDRSPSPVSQSGAAPVGGAFRLGRGASGERLPPGCARTPCGGW